jgi:hypothetical protein
MVSQERWLRVAEPLRDEQSEKRRSLIAEWQRDDRFSSAAMALLGVILIAAGVVALMATTAN